MAGETETTSTTTTTAAAAPAATTTAAPAAAATTTAEPAALPDAVDLHGAVALMAGLKDDEPAPAAHPGGEAAAVPAANGEPAAEPNAGEPGAETQTATTTATDANTAPEFWAAEDKAAFALVPEAVRPILAKYEKQRDAYVREKQREATTHVSEARTVAEHAFNIVAENAKWWQANREAWNKSFGDRWASVDWDDLAVNHPAEHTRLTHERNKERGLLDEANRRGEEAQRVANERATTARAEARRAEYGKLAAKLPEFFGDATKSKATYEELGNFLHKEAGLPIERVNAIWEASLIELALDAMRYRKAQAKISPVLNGDGKPAAAGAANTSAATSTVRVTPGPAKPAANQGSERVRQARERIRSGQSVDTHGAAALISSIGA